MQNHLEVLLDPPFGYYTYALNWHLDEGAPETPTPRPASEREAAMVRDMRDMQTAISRKFGSRKKPSSEDKKTIFAAFPPERGDAGAIYEVAINAMD
jgi:hypothetical protein